jgi:hypothetical protein
MDSPTVNYTYSVRVRFNSPHPSRALTGTHQVMVTCHLASADAPSEQSTSLMTSRDKNALT